MMIYLHLFFVILSFVFVPNSAFSSDSPLNISAFSAKDILTGQTVIVDSQKQKKGIVAVFLSAHCPCSNSHIQELSSLSKEFTDFLFVGIHSNQDETASETKTYFKDAHLPFKVLQDEKALLADKFGALKTPHSYIVSPNGEILFKGGVSSSHTFESAEHKFLREALEDVQLGKKVRNPEARTLGCTISREG